MKVFVFDFERFPLYSILMNVVFRFKRPSYGEEFQANALFFETLNFFGVDNETQTEVDE